MGGIRIVLFLPCSHTVIYLQKIVPLVLAYPKNEGNFARISIKISGSEVPHAIAHIQQIWKQYLPEIPFEYTFMDENFSKLYVAQEKQGTIFSIFSGIAIFIACLGLFGLSSFTISQRIKEICQDISQN